MNVRDRLVWITGASSGIGETLAYTLSQRGAHLVLSARREDALDAVRQHCARPDDHFVCPLDLSDPPSLRDAADSVRSHAGPVDVLVNNAGISQRGRAQETEMKVVRRIMEVNFFGTVQLTKAVLPSMLNRKQGHIVVVSSVSGKIGTPGRSTYSASKHALHGWFDSLRAEVHDEGVRVTLICPGYVKTNIAQNALREDGSTGKNAEAKGISPEKCAQTIVEAIEQEKAETYVGRWEVLGIYLKRFAPSLLRRILRNYPGS